MRQATGDDKLLIQYLLGELPPEQRDLLEERYFSDDALHDQLIAIEDDLVDAYARGQLSATEKDDFERHFLNSPERRAKLEFAEAFVRFADTASAKDLVEFPLLTSAGLTTQPIQQPEDVAASAPTVEPLRSSGDIEEPLQRPAATTARQEQLEIKSSIRTRMRGLLRGAAMRWAFLSASLVSIIALAVINIYLYLQLDHVRTDLAELRDSMGIELTNLRNTSSLTTASQKQHLEDLRAQLENARTLAKQLATTAANSAASQAKAEAEERAEQLGREIQAEQAKVQQQVSSEISDVKNSASAANTKIADVSTDVSFVKTSLASTNAELQRTIADLKTARGDLGVQSGLIATNAAELAALKRLGERNYFEFRLGKTKTPQRVGDITLRLTKVDPEKNKYSVEVMADDKLTEKKDKNLNEPVQFYTSKAKIPYELVVNSMSKDQIAGYLSTPKDQLAR